MQPTAAAISTTACSSFTFNNQVYITSGTYTQVRTNAVGCDSTITLYLTINDPVIDSQYVTICTGSILHVGNSFYTNSGLYTNTFTGMNGCDSTVVTNLIVKLPIDAAILQTGINLEANKSNAFYQWIDCNSNNILSGQISQTFTPVSNGNYAVIINDGYCADTSNCIVISKPVDNVEIYPNPSSGIFNLIVSIILKI